MGLQHGERREVADRATQVWRSVVVVCTRLVPRAAGQPCTIKDASDRNMDGDRRIALFPVCCPWEGHRAA